jgi:hypothetical protein
MTCPLASHNKRFLLDFVWIAVYRTARGQGIMPVAMMRACCEAPMPMMARLAMV